MSLMGLFIDWAQLKNFSEPEDKPIKTSKIKKRREQTKNKIRMSKNYGNTIKNIHVMVIPEEKKKNKKKPQKTKTYLKQ